MRIVEEISDIYTIYRFVITMIHYMLTTIEIYSINLWIGINSTEVQNDNLF